MSSGPVFNSFADYVAELNKSRKSNRRITPFTVGIEIVKVLKKKKPWPICARCKKPVNSFDLFQGLNSMGEELEFEARCHGNVERFYMSKRDILMLDDIQAGEAFRDDAQKDLAMSKYLEQLK